MRRKRAWPKVGNDLTWARYGGWTILSDPADGHRFTAAESSHDAHSLSPLTDHLRERLISAKLATVATLPAATHHVTVCDGVNPAMLARAPRRRDRRTLEAGEIERFPPQLSDSITLLLEVASKPLDVRTTGTELRNTAIVVSLEPAAANAAVFADICAARGEVLTALGELLGLDLDQPWRPHVTLGYLADRNERSSAAAVIVELDELASATGDALRMQGAGLYRFTSMVDFQRVPPLGLPT